MDSKISSKRTVDIHRPSRRFWSHSRRMSIGSVERGAGGNKEEKGRTLSFFDQSIVYTCIVQHQFHPSVIPKYAIE